MHLLPEHQETYLQELFELLRFPSISTLPEHKDDIHACVDWLEDYLKKSGFEESAIEELYGKGLSRETNHPVLYAERIDNPDNPTVLIYGHYDVQPVDPLNEWKSEPFEPEVRDGSIYGRGTTDDKGQLFTHLAALNYLSEKWGESWPINVKLLLEGEEEQGGENVEKLVTDEKYREKFAADYCFLSDTGFVAPGKPTIDYGLRGMAYMQIDVKLCDRDLHSGLFGGGVLNPANALTQILSQLENPQTGKVLIPGFYDDVVDVDETERTNLSEIPYDEATFLKDAGNARAVRPEEGYTVTESTAARPNLTINGIWGGFMGEGAKTIIPATAHAKVSIRTVGNQDPEKIGEMFKDYVEKITPQEVDVSVDVIHVGDGVLVSTDSPAIKLAQAALEETFGAPVVFSRSGGSIPIVALIKKHLDIDPVLIGYGLPDDGLHSPNEKMSLEHFEKGIECNIHLYTSIAS